MHPSSKWAYFHRVASYWPNRSEAFFSNTNAITDIRAEVSRNEAKF